MYWPGIACCFHRPVGPSDGAGQHNTTRIMRTCAQDGTILQPERPLVPIDATYRQALSASERQLGAAAIWATYSRAAGKYQHPGQYQYHVIGVDVIGGARKGVDVFASDMYPVPAGGTVFAVRDWHRSRTCRPGADAVASGCVRVTTGTGSDALVSLDGGIQWPFGTHTTQLYTVTVLEPGMVALLGELGKFVPLSSKRFSNVKASATGLTATVQGQEGEVVHATALVPHGSTWVVACGDATVGAQGTGQLSFAAV